METDGAHPLATPLSMLYSVTPLRNWDPRVQGLYKLEACAGLVVAPSLHNSYNSVRLLLDCIGWWDLTHVPGLLVKSHNKSFVFSDVGHPSWSILKHLSPHIFVPSPSLLSVFLLLFQPFLPHLFPSPVGKTQLKCCLPGQFFPVSSSQNKSFFWPEPLSIVCTGSLIQSVGICTSVYIVETWVKGFHLIPGCISTLGLYKNASIEHPNLAFSLYSDNFLLLSWMFVNI